MEKEMKKENDYEGILIFEGEYLDGIKVFK